MKITVNSKTIEVSGKQPLIEELRSMGYSIPSLCYHREAKHQASCMVCAVRNVANGQMIPSCSTFPTEGMQIEVDSEEVMRIRRMSLELLLSDHRADCEAPCSMVCPHGIDIARVILHYDRGEMKEAREVLASATTAGALPCDDCKAGCEKVCRRKAVDANVDIRQILREVAESKVATGNAPSPLKKDERTAVSKVGRYSELEKEWLKEVYGQASHCLHCACEGKEKCKLRTYASEAGIKSSRYGVSSNLMVKEQQHVKGRLYYEPAKCVRCGLCVYNSQDAFTFMHRGFNMQVVIPEESKEHAEERLAELCPTGALFLK